MATKFVFSGATGLNNGTSKADAWVSIASSTGVAAGDLVNVNRLHNEAALAAAPNWSNGTVSNPVRIVATDWNTDVEDTSPNAIFGWTANGSPTGNVYFKGLRLQGIAATLTPTPPTGGQQTLERCKLEIVGGGAVNVSLAAASARKSLRLINTDIDLSAGGSASNAINIAAAGDGTLEWLGGTCTLRSTQTNLFTMTGSALTTARIAGVTFNGTVTNLISSSATGFLILDVIGCVPPTYTNLWSTAPTVPGTRLNLQGFQSGNLTTALLQPTQIWRPNGTIAADLTHYRNSGAADGSQATPYSWQLASSANANNIVSPLQAPPLLRWLDAGARTITVYISSGITLHDDDCWVEVISPSEANPATGLGRFQSTRANVLATPASLATDAASTWNGAGLGVNQKITFTVSPTVPGPILVRFNLARPTTTVYIDPMLGVA